MTYGRAGGLKNREPLKGDSTGGHLKVAFDQVPGPGVRTLGHDPSIPELSDAMSAPAESAAHLNFNQRIHPNMPESAIRNPKLKWGLSLGSIRWKITLNPLSRHSKEDAGGQGAIG